MLTGPYEPCPCGSGKKYRFCCQKQDREVADAARRTSHVAAQDLITETIDLDELSNRANDLTRKRKWEEAEAVCAELRQRFPNETDADERLAALYMDQCRFAEAKTHTLAALATAQRQPDRFDQELVDDLKDEVTYLDACIAAGRLVD